MAGALLNKAIQMVAAQKAKAAPTSTPTMMVSSNGIKEPVIISQPRVAVEPQIRIVKDVPTVTLTKDEIYPAKPILRDDNIIPQNVPTKTPEKMGTVSDTIGVVGKVTTAIGNVKTTDTVLMRMRDQLMSWFKAAGGVYSKPLSDGKTPIEKAIILNKLTHADVANQKVASNYDAEWARLHKAVKDAFTLAGRSDLANQFELNVPKWTAAKHEGGDYVATLLKGASSGPAVAGQNDRFAILKPFRGLMEDALTVKGVKSPPDIGDLTQLFYNNYVAGKDAATPVIAFDEMPPSMVYHVDESIVNAVVAYFKSLADRKKSGETLPKTLDRLAEGTLKVEASLTDKVKEGVAGEIGKGIMNNSTVIIIAVVVALILIVWLIAKKA